MRIGMLILGLIGALIGLGGSAVTMLGGFGGTAVGVLAENQGTANGGAFVFWSGVMALVVNIVAIISSVTGGVAKKKNTIFAFAIATLVCGLLGIYLYNWFSGLLVTIAGILGVVGAKDGLDDQQPLKKSALVYVTSVVLVILAGASMLVKNGRAVVEHADAEVAQAAQAEGQELDVAARAAEAPAAVQAPADTAPPFVGKRSFNFEGGSAGMQVITINEHGHAYIEHEGPQVTVMYDGPYSNPLQLLDGSGLLFRDGKVYQTSGGAIAKSCREEGLDCVSDLYQL